MKDVQNCHVCLIGGHLDIFCFVRKSKLHTLQWRELMGYLFLISLSCISKARSFLSYYDNADNNNMQVDCFSPYLSVVLNKMLNMYEYVCCYCLQLCRYCHLSISSAQRHKDLVLYNIGGIQMQQGVGNRFEEKTQSPVSV